MHVSVGHCHYACPQGITSVLTHAHHTVTSSMLCSVLPFFILQYFSHGTFYISLPTVLCTLFTSSLSQDHLLSLRRADLVGLCYVRLGIIGHCHFVLFSTDVQYSSCCMGVCFFLFLLILSTVCGIKNSKYGSI